MEKIGITRVSTHLLDTGIGKPAAGVPVRLEHVGPGGSTTVIGEDVTDGDGRVASLNPDALDPGEYRLVFSTAEYFAEVHGEVFYPRIAVDVILPDGRAHFHIPVLASAFSYSTYLGS